MYTALSTRQLETFSSFFNPSFCPKKSSPTNQLLCQACQEKPACGLQNAASTAEGLFEKLPRSGRTHLLSQATANRKKKNYSGMYMSQSMFNTLYASVHTERKEKNFTSKSIFLLKRMLFARQHCDWPPVPDFDHKACNVRHG